MQARARFFLLFFNLHPLLGWLGHIRQMPTWRRSRPLSTRGRLFATFRPLSLYHVSHVYKSQRSARNVLNAGVARFFSLFICVCEIFFVILQRKIKTIIIMPEISSFYGIAIYMYMSEHNPPHFHVKYQGYEAIITIKDGVITGSLPRRALRMVYEWLDQHQDELLANWERLGKSEEPMRIDPLQ